MEIVELTPSAFARAGCLFAGGRPDLAQIGAGLEGRTPGRLFVDAARDPTAALLCRSYGYYPAGDPGGPGGRALRRFMADMPAEASVFGSLYAYVPPSDPWRRALLDDHGDALEVVERRAFVLPADGEMAAEAVAAGQWSGTDGCDARANDVTIVDLDPTLAERVDATLAELIGYFWGGYDGFGAGGFGTVALLREEPVAAAYAIAVGRGDANVGVVTADDFRRRGLATAVGRRFVAQARVRGLRPTWGCDADNAASRALARRLGFQPDPTFARYDQLSPADDGERLLSRGLWASVSPPTDQDILRRWVRVA